MPALRPYRASADTWVLPSYLPVPGIGLIVVNSYLIESADGRHRHRYGCRQAGVSGNALVARGPSSRPLDLPDP